MLNDYLNNFPLIAILRGIQPDEAVGIAEVLYTAGFRCIEVPLNSPEPYDSIRAMRDALPADCLIGAGTVLQEEQVAKVKHAGGELIVMPHSDGTIIRAAKALNMYCAPGVATPTEGFAALHNGADALKLFPAEQLPPVVLNAWRSVFPKTTMMIPVGGITSDNLSVFWGAGASGFGLGSALYKRGLTAEEVAVRAQMFAQAVKALIKR